MPWKSIMKVDRKLMKLLGIVVKEVTAGWAVCNMVVREDMVNSHLYCQGGLTPSRPVLPFDSMSGNRAGVHLCASHLHQPRQVRRYAHRHRSDSERWRANGQLWRRSDQSGAKGDRALSRAQIIWWSSQSLNELLGCCSECEARLVQGAECEARLVQGAECVARLVQGAECVARLVQSTDQ